MSHMAIVTDLNRCVGCLACNVACKALNNVEPGLYWNKTVRVGPNPRQEGGQFPDVEMYFITVQCQHCANPQCVSVCPTGASHVAEDGTVQIDADQCIGCGACLPACPYGVRYLEVDSLVARKCDLCASQVADGGLPQCVAQCGGMARFYGDLDEGIETFEGPEMADGKRIVLGEFCAPFTDDEVHALPDSGNEPNMRYILRGMTWREDAGATFDDWRTPLSDE